MENIPRTGTVPGDRGTKTSYRRGDGSGVRVYRRNKEKERGGIGKQIVQRDQDGTTRTSSSRGPP